MTKRSFFFHFNKPKTLQAGKAQITVHHRGVCHIVDNVSVAVPTQGRIRKSQPRFVMTGKCSEVRIVDGVAHIS